MACDVNIWEIFVFCSQFDWLKLSTLTIGKQWQILHYVGRTNIVLGVYMLRNFLSWDIPWLWVFVVFFSPTPEGHQWECRVCGGHHRHHWHLPRSARWVWKEWSRPPWWENTVWKRWTFAWGTLHNVEQKKTQRGTDDFYWSGMWLYYIFLCLWSGIDNSGNCTPWNASCLKLFPAALQPIHETRGLSPQVTVGCWRRCPVSPCTTNSLSRWCRPTKAWPSLMLASSISGWVIYWVERPHKVLLCLSSVKPRMRHSSLRAAPTSGQLRLESYLQLPMLHYSHNQKHK